MMKTRGVTLIEIVIGIALVAVLIVVFGVSLLAAVYAQRVKLRNMAGALADEQLSALQTIDTSQFAVQADGPLRGVLFTQGTFGAVDDATAPSSGRALDSATSSGGGITAVLPLPKNAYGDFTMTAAMKAVAGSPANWKIGFLFRASDLQNGYRVSLAADSLTLDKIVNGAVTTLYSDIRTIIPGTWQTLSVTTSGTSIGVSLNGLNVTDQTDASFSAGQAALAAWEGVGARFDDAAIGGAAWNFDAAAIGAIPDDWSRFGLDNLPSGAGTLSIETPYADASLKKYTVKINWTDRSGPKSISQSLLKAN